MVPLSTHTQIKVYNLDRARTIRDLNPEDIDTLVSVQGMVTRTSSILPDLRCALIYFCFIFSMLSAWASAYEVT